MVRKLLCASLLVAACSHDNAKPTGPTTKIGPVSAEQTAAAAKDLLGFLPADSEIVAGFDANQLRQSTIWKKFAPVLMDKMTAQMKGMQTTCGFDPVQTIQTMSFGFKNITDSPQGVMVVHGFDQTKVMDCVAKLKLDMLKVDNGIITISTGSSTNVAVEFVDPTTMVAFVGAGAAREGLQAAVQAGTPLRSSAAFTAMFGNVNTGEAVWGLVNGNSKMFDSAGFHPRAAFGSMKTSDGLAIHAHIKMPSPDAAQSTSAMIDSQVGPARGFVQTLEVAATGDDVAISVIATEAQIEAAMAMAGQ